MKVAFFSESDKGACHQYRVEYPVEELKKLGIQAVFSTRWDNSVSNSDIYFFQRNSTKEAMQIIHNLAKEKRITIYDIDDDILHLPESNPVFNLYMNNPHIPWNQITGMRYANLISVSCTGLQYLYQSINPRIQIFPNCIRVAEWEHIEPLLRRNDKVRIFWGGSPTHKEDLSILNLVAPAIKRRFKDKVEFVIMGQEGIDLRCEFTRIPFGPYSFFQGVSKSCQIGLAPMAVTKFNLGKSDLRLKEIGASGQAIVASNVGEYSKPESGALLCTTPQSWVEALVSLIEDPEKLSAKSVQAKEWAFSWDIGKHIHIWVDTFEELIDERNRGIASKGIRVQSHQRPSNVPSRGKIRVGQLPNSGDNNPNS